MVTSMLLVGLSAALLCWSGLRLLRAVAQARHAALERLGSRDLADLFVFVDAGVLTRSFSVALLFVPVCGLLLGWGPFVTLLLFGLMVVGPGLWFRTFRRRRALRLVRQLPEGLLALATLLRSGSGLSVALSSTATYIPRPLADEWTLLARQLRMGVPLHAAIATWATRIASHEARAVASLLAVAHVQGGALAPALEQLASTGRRRIAMEDRIVALTAQGRLQGWIVSALPLLVAVALHSLDPSAMRPLTHSLRGGLVCALIVALQCLGWWGIRRVTAIRV